MKGFSSISLKYMKAFAQYCPDFLIGQQSAAQLPWFETTLSGLGYLRHIRDWRASGYHVTLFFLTLPSIEMAIARVAERVSQGGHDIPEAVIRRRFVTGVRNLYGHYRDAVNAWAVYDNSGDQPMLTHWSENV